MSEGDGVLPEQRLSISLATLRAELTTLELRLVDRLNGALQSKADRAIQDQLAARVSDFAGRMTILEAESVKRNGPFTTKLEQVERELTSLSTLASYRKWIFVQGIAVAGLAVGVIGMLIQGGGL